MSQSISNKKAAIVVTTINSGDFLEDYYVNLKEYGHLDQVSLHIIVDFKTPKDLYAATVSYQKKGLNARAYSIPEQEEALKKFGLPSSFLLTNSDHRRNVGYLIALETGADVVISIDDDNYPHPGVDFFAEHVAAVTLEQTGPEYENSTGFHNICELLEFDLPGTTYARGYPYFARHQENAKVTVTEQTRQAHLNAGLWLIDPDVDAISWLVMPRKSQKLLKPAAFLSPNTWSPINSQNTAMRREAVAAYYFVRMGFPLQHGKIDRYGDIFQGYFVQACTKHLDGSVRAGSPTVQHRRNSHNFMFDAGNELACIQILEDVLQWLIHAKLQGSTYPETYRSLAHELREAAEKINSRFWSDATRAYFHQMSYQMIQWANVTQKWI